MNDPEPPSPSSPSSTLAPKAGAHRPYSPAYPESNPSGSGSRSRTPEITGGPPTLLYDEESQAPPEFVDRWSKRLASFPGYSRSSSLLGVALGPTERKKPSHPTSHLQAAWAWILRKAGVAWHRSMEHPLDHLLYRFSRRWKLQWFWLPFLLVWILGNALFLRAQYYLPGPEVISCTASLFDSWPPDVCGLKGQECAEYLQQATYRCPGGCHETPLGNPRWVGNTSVNGVPYVVGGHGVYRADSWICAAGVHAGIVSPRYGGCVSVTPLPYPEGTADFPGYESSGLTSTAFSPNYPGAYRLTATGSRDSCMDYHWPITAFNAVMLFVYTLLFTPPPVVLFSTLLVLGFYQITLVSDPPRQPPDWSLVLQRLLPVLVTGYWIWRVSFARSLNAFYAAKLFLEMAFWQGLGFWIGIESSTLFAKIPISRLGYGALSADAVIALIIIVVLVIVVVGIQVLQYRRLGHVRYYLAWYLPLVPILILLATIGRGYHLRLHHYMLSLLGLPVLSLPNRVSIAGQGFLLAFFLDGVGRWGWASILEHEDDLRGDSAAGTWVPTFVNHTRVQESNYEFIDWTQPNTTAIKGRITYSVLFDDILIKSNYTALNFSISQGTKQLDGDHFLRIAYEVNGTTLDFTDPSVWNGTTKRWTPSPTDMEDDEKELYEYI